MSISNEVSTGGKKPVVRRRGQTGALVDRKGVWCGRWREYVKQADGTEKSVERFKAFPGLSERAARVVFQEITCPSSQALTLLAVIDKWRSLLAGNLKPRGKAAAESHLKAHIVPKLGNYAVQELSTEIVQRFIQDSKPTLSGKSVVNVVSTLRTILYHARKQEWIKGDEPVKFDSLILPEKVSEPALFLTGKEIKKLIKASRGVIRTILIVLALTGMRINEVLGLRVGDIDFEDKVIHVTKSAYKGKLGTPKSKASTADIPLSAMLAKELRKHLKSKHYRENALGVLFANRNLRPYS